MPHRVYQTFIQASPQQVWDFHRSAEALRILTPPDRQVELLDDDLDVHEGALHRIRIRQFGIPVTWHARIHDVKPPFGFSDRAERSPFYAWDHLHQFIPHEDGTLLRDTVSFVASGGPFGGAAEFLFVNRLVDGLFAYRHKVTKEALENQ